MKDISLGALTMKMAWALYNQAVALAVPPKQSIFPDHDCHMRTLANFQAALLMGRHATFHLQKEYAHTEGFDDWWKAQRQMMSDDPIFTLMKHLRTEIVHTGVDYFAYSVTLYGSSSEDILKGMATGSRETRIPDEEGWILHDPSDPDHPSYDLVSTLEEYLRAVDLLVIEADNRFRAARSVS